MTDSPEGRTYIDYRLDVREGAREYFSVRYGCWLYEDKDVTEVQTPYVVPNGKWVMERPYGWAWLIGVEFDELEVFQYADKQDTKHVLYISDKPFGYIVADEQDVDMTVYPRVIKPNGRKRLVCARQIHKGELGQTVPIPRIKYVRQAFEPNQRLSVRKSRERRRSNYGWVRLPDLVAATGIGVQDTVFGFWNYSGHRNNWLDNGQDGGVLLDIVRAWEDEIKGEVPAVRSLTKHEAAMMLGGWHDWNFYVGDIWVRRGFAYTVLRLTALGVRPEVTQPV